MSSTIMEALYRGDRAAAEELAPDAELDIDEAASLGRTERVRELLAGDPKQPLHSAAAVEATETARLLLDAGADPNARQEGGFRPIDAAVQSRNGELYALLVEHGAEPPPPAE